MNTNRAYCLLHIKAVEGAEPGAPRRFKGTATTPSTDRSGDVVDPQGAQFKLPIPLLWQHDSRQPIGWVRSAKATAKGIEIEGEVADVAEAGTLKNRLDEAWQSLKAGLVQGLSIGFKPVESARIGDSYSYHYLKWLWLELSAVTIPANGDCSIHTIKSIDTQQRAASGQSPPGSGGTGPGASGTTRQPASSGLFHTRSQKGIAMKTIQELKEAREQKAARMQELAQLREAENRKSTPEEATEFDQLADEVSEIDDEIRTLKAHQLNASTARDVRGGNAAEGGAARGRGPAIIINREAEEKFKGQAYVRRVIAKALSRLDDCSPLVIAQKRWGRSNPMLVNVIKADVAGGGSDSGEWGAELVAADGRYTGDFIEFLHGMTVFDRLPLRSVPANVTIKGQDGAATGYWVGQSKAIPATAADFSAISLTPMKVGALAVISNELLRDSSPSAEMLVRDALAEASAQRVDGTFLSNAALSAGVSPAGILNGVTVGTSGGTTADDLRADIAGLMASFIAAKNVSGLHFVTTPALALQIQLLRNALGQREFPGVSMTGGELEGMPLITGDNVGAGDLLLMKPSDIWKIGDTGVEVSISREAMIEQDNAPTGATDTPVAASTKFTSMFQSESTAIKVVRSINFQKRRSGAVSMIGDADYGTATSI